MPRFFLPPEQWTPECLELTGDEAHHAAKVLRLKEGEACEVFDGFGRVASGVVAAPPSNRSLIIRLNQVSAPDPSESTSQPRKELVLYQAIPKGTNMDWIVQKAVELGVTHIVPLITARTIVRLTGKEIQAKQAKWERVALEACKQCGQNTLPVIALPVEFNQWLESKPCLPDCAIVGALADNARPLHEALATEETLSSLGALIGPEGDFTPQELQSAIAYGFRPVTLGEIILRSETAALFTLSVLRYTLDQAFPPPLPPTVSSL